MKAKGNKCSRGGVLLRVLLGVLLVLLIAAVIYVSDYYHADQTALAVLEHPTVELHTESNRLVFLPEDPEAGLIFYPGGKVEYTAYAPLMQKLAEKGVLCVLVKMPLNLAVLNGDAADGIPEEFPEVDVWAVGGHSLGGVMAADFAARHPGAVDALVLLAAYSTADLSQSGIRVLSVYGTEDGVLQRDKYESYRANLPTGLTELPIEGGCHAWFGSYGPQKGDGAPSISADQQQTVTAAAVSEFLIP